MTTGELPLLLGSYPGLYFLHLDAPARPRQKDNIKMNLRKLGVRPTLLLNRQQSHGLLLPTRVMSPQVPVCDAASSKCLLQQSGTASRCQHGAHDERRPQDRSGACNAATFGR